MNSQSPNTIKIDVPGTTINFNRHKPRCQELHNTIGRQKVMVNGKLAEAKDKEVYQSERDGYTQEQTRQYQTINNERSERQQHNRKMHPLGSAYKYNTKFPCETPVRGAPLQV